MKHAVNVDGIERLAEELGKALRSLPATGDMDVARARDELKGAIRQANAARTTLDVLVAEGVLVQAAEPEAEEPVVVSGGVFNTDPDNARALREAVAADEAARDTAEADATTGDAGEDGGNVDAGDQA